MARSDGVCKADTSGTAQVRSTNPQRGSLILVVLCLLAVLGIALASFLAIGNQSMKLSNRSFRTAASAQLAETGLEEALRAFNQNNWDNWSPNPTNVSSGAWTLDTTNHRATRTIQFLTGKLGQGVTGTINLRVDNYDAHVLGATWSDSKNYQIDDVVGYNGMWYRCVTAHTNQAPTATGNLAYWVPAPIPWKWNSDNTYSQNDVVNHNGTWYRFGPATPASTTEPSPTSADWLTIPSNVRTWDSSTTYFEYDIVTHNGRNYRCFATNTNQSPPDTDYWSETVNSISLSWAPNNAVYTVGAIVFNDGSWYTCIANHQSSSTFSNDSANWDTITWSASTTYNMGAIVYYLGTWYSYTGSWSSAYYSGGTTYSSGCTAYYTTTGAWYRYIYPIPAAGVAPTNATYWEQISSTYATWDSSTSYKVGDRVKYNGSWYICNNSHSNQAPPNKSYWTATNFVSWQYLVKSYQFNDVAYYSTSGNGTWYRRNKNSPSTVAVPTSTSNWENALTASWDWASGDNYNIGDVVNLSGNFYRCIRAHSNYSPPNTTYWSPDPLHSPSWDSVRSYSQYDTAYYRGSWYLSLLDNNVTTPGTEIAYWAVAPRSISAWDSTRNYSLDDFVSSGGTWYRCIKDTTANQATSNATYWVALTGSAYQWSAATAYTTSVSLANHVNHGGVWYRCISAHSDQSPNNSTYWTPSWKQSWQPNSTDATGAPVIYAEGSVTLPDSSAPIKTQLRATIAPAPLFSNAVAATGTVTVGSGAGTVDSYDSTQGTYASPGGFSATIASSHTSNPAISITGTTAVSGYLATPSASTTPFAPLYTIGGTVKGASTPGGTTIDPTRISRSPFIPQFDIKAAIQQTVLPSTLPTTLNLGTPGAPTPSVYYDTSPSVGTTININGPVILYISGNLRVNTSEVININSTGSLVVYITGSTTGRLRVESTSGGIINRSPSSTNPDPKNLVILGDTAYTSTQYYSYTGSPFYGVIYLPNITNTTGLTIASGVTIHGALSAKEITFSGAANLHYDTSLRYATFTGVDQPWAVTEWRELTDPNERAVLP